MALRQTKPPSVGTSTLQRPEETGVGTSKLEPYVEASSLSGAFKARLAWKLRLDLLRGARTDDGSAQIERLFGREGFRGVLELRVNEPRRKGSEKITSLQIDRFTGAVMENLLYTTDADFGVTFEVEFHPDRRATQSDLDLIHILKTELLATGITLGHGTSRGFGWFNVSEVPSHPQPQA